MFVLGYYVFTEMSTSGLFFGDSAWLVSEHLPATNEGCMFFWYHMYGRGEARMRDWRLKSEVEKEREERRGRESRG